MPSFHPDTVARDVTGSFNDLTRHFNIPLRVRGQDRRSQRRWKYRWGVTNHRLENPMKIDTEIFYAARQRVRLSTRAVAAAGTSGAVVFNLEKTGDVAQVSFGVLGRIAEAVGLSIFRPPPPGRRRPPPHR